jgi:23S rRNA (uracil1939-C5)-methyltransferase
MKLKKGERVVLKIDKYAFEGKGIAKVNKEKLFGAEADSGEENYVIFVNGSYPGDKVKARITKIKKSYAEGVAEEILEPSEYRTSSNCKYFGTCGGCKQQDLDYREQVKYKQLQIEELFTRMGGFTGFIVEKIIAAEKTFFYRNKMEFSFSQRRWLTEAEIKSEMNIGDELAVGLHAPGAYDKVLNIEECFLQSELSNRILNFTRDFFRSRDIPAYSTRTHEGWLRNLVIKESHHTKDFMVNLVTSSENKELMEEYTNKIISDFPEVTTVINNINLKKASVATGDYEIVYYGPGYIYDTIGEYKYRISANSFFQTNTLQAEKLYQLAADYAEFSKNEVAYDLYSGAGTISLYISKFVKQVFAFESVESAIKDAEVNGALNNVNNVKFYKADLYKSMMPVVEEDNIPKPDVMVIDPPRGGMHQNTINDVIKLNPKRIVYVSCNPATQVRDIKLLSEGGYKPVKMRGVDMFPHTFHIENVALLVKE